MAEIKIEKKKPIWPWILLAVVLLAAIAYFVYANTEDDDYPDDVETEEIDDLNDTTYEDSTTYEDTVDYSDTINGIMEYSESIKDTTRIGIDSTYTKSALYNLSRAVTQKATQYNIENSTALENLKQYSMSMDGMATNSIANTTGSYKNLKNVSDNIVTVLQSIQMKNFPNLQKDVAGLKQASMKITSTDLQKQQPVLQQFFRQANDVLNKMNS